MLESLLFECFNTIQTGRRDSLKGDQDCIISYCFCISAPSRAPFFVIAQTSSSTSLVIKWSHLLEEHFQGQPIGYYVTYFPANFKVILTDFVNVNLESNNTTLLNLTAHTMYVINVSAVSTEGVGLANTAKARTLAAGNL